MWYISLEREEVNFFYCIKASATPWATVNAGRPPEYLGPELLHGGRAGLIKSPNARRSRSFIPEFKIRKLFRRRREL